MLTYTTCPGCDQSHVVTRPGDDMHESCPIPPGPRGLRRRLVNAIIAGDDEAADRYSAQLDAIDDAPPRLLDAALTYASWGWPVFPCRPGGKAPAYERGVFEHGLRQASTDLDQIRAWWTRWPAANIGLPTGHAFDVIDVDPLGVRWWAVRRERYGGQPGGPYPDIHGEVATPRPGGSHVYVQPSGRGNLADFLPGVDYRGVGGYVVAPPSVLNPAVYSDQGKTVPDVAHLTYTWTVYPSPALTRGVRNV